MFLIEGSKGYQMLLTGSKNINPSPSYRILKFAIFIQLQIAVAHFYRDYLKILIFEQIIELGLRYRAADNDILYRLSVTVVKYIVVSSSISKT